LPSALEAVGTGEGVGAAATVGGAGAAVVPGADVHEARRDPRRETTMETTMKRAGNRISRLTVEEDPRHYSMAPEGDGWEGQGSVCMMQLGMNRLASAMASAARTRPRARLNGIGAI